MAKPKIILGAGGHARVLIDILKVNGDEILGITEYNSELINTKVCGITVLGHDDIIFNYSATEVQLINGIGSVGNTQLRRKTFEKFKGYGYTFANVIHPSAIISSGVEISEGVQIMAGAIVQPGAQLGENSIINTRAAIDHECIIGKHAHLAPGVTLSGNVQVSDGVHIGTGATIIQGITIGENSLIGAGAVVVNDIPRQVKAIGIPAKVV